MLTLAMLRFRFLFNIDEARKQERGKVTDVPKGLGLRKGQMQGAYSFFQFKCEREENDVQDFFP